MKELIYIRCQFLLLSKQEAVKFPNRILGQKLGQCICSRCQIQLREPLALWQERHYFMTRLDYRLVFINMNNLLKLWVVCLYKNLLHEDDAKAMHGGRYGSSLWRIFGAADRSTIVLF